MAGIEHSGGEFIAMLKNHLQILMLARAHGDHEPPAIGKLVEQWLRYFGR